MFTCGRCKIDWALCKCGTRWSMFIYTFPFDVLFPCLALSSKNSYYTIRYMRRNVITSAPNWKRVGYLSDCVLGWVIRCASMYLFANIVDFWNWAFSGVILNRGQTSGRVKYACTRTCLSVSVSAFWCLSNVTTKIILTTRYLCLSPRERNTVLCGK